MGWRVPSSVKPEPERDEYAENVQPLPDKQSPIVKAPDQAPTKLSKSDAQKRREELRRASNNGRSIPFIAAADYSPNSPRTQQDYDWSRIEAMAEVAKMEDEAREKRGGRPIVRGCTTCNPARRTQGPDCTGSCELQWR